VKAMRQKDTVNEVILDIKSLTVDFSYGKKKIRAVDHLDLQLKRGEITVLLGESGSGKSVTAMSIIDLLDKNASIDSGEILVNNKNVLNMSKKEKQIFRRNEVSMVFQNPVDALNPLMTIGDQMIEAIVVDKKDSKKEALSRSIEWLETVHLDNPENIINKYPFELSGGMCQRVLIAMAMVGAPRLLIADEPTTALDVTVQAQILDEICSMRKRFNTDILFITHDLGIVAEIADYVYIMRHGKVVENNTVYNIFKSPENSYTIELMDSIL
jgi:ABC-type dipeptide/oligopeptide/nickel transport system, ATPase component